VKSISPVAESNTIVENAADVSRRPMAQAARIPLFEREVRQRLSQAAVELLFEGAQVLCEGSLGAGATSATQFFGSVMVTILLDDLAAQVREAPTDDTAEKVAELMGGDARVLGRLRRLAESEATRIAGRPVRVHSADVRIRAEGPRILVDIDIES